MYDNNKNPQKGGNLMKKNLLIFIMLFGILISISSCKNASVYDVKIDGISYEVNSIDKTSHDGK